MQIQGTLFQPVNGSSMFGACFLHQKCRMESYRAVAIRLLPMLISSHKTKQNKKPLRFPVVLWDLEGNLARKASHCSQPLHAREFCILPRLYFF